MIERALLLQAFPAGNPPDLRLTGAVSRRGGRLTLRHSLQGPLDTVVLPSRVDAPHRVHGLWEHTCFEAFLAPRGAGQYWEINLSPSGDWNVYRFRGYREGMAEEPAFGTLSCRLEHATDLLSLEMDIDLEAIGSARDEIHAGLAAVIRHRDGSTSYWALSHPGPTPDFHRPESFLLVL